MLLIGRIPLLRPQGENQVKFVRGVVRCSTPEERSLAYHRLVLVDTGDDGVSQWTAIAQNSPGPRTELVYNFDPDSAPEQGHAAIRYKYIQYIEEH